jgi:hypothetical protein
LLLFVHTLPHYRPRQQHISVSPIIDLRYEEVFVLCSATCKDLGIIQNDRNFSEGGNSKLYIPSIRFVIVGVPQASNEFKRSCLLGSLSRGVFTSYTSNCLFCDRYVVFLLMRE